MENNRQELRYDGPNIAGGYKKKERREMKCELGMAARYIALMLFMVVVNSAVAGGKYHTADLAYSGKGPWIMDYNIAKQKAEKEHKDLYVLFTGSDWCKNCKMLENTILSYAGFIDNVTNDFVLVFLDKPRSRSLEAKIPQEAREQRNAWAKKLEITGVPTQLLMTTDGYVYRRIEGTPQLTPEVYASEVIKAKHAYRERILIQKRLKSSNLSAEERVQLLDKLLDSMSIDVVEKEYSEELNDILRLDAGNKAGKEMKYKARVVIRDCWKQIRKTHYKECVKIAEKALSEYKYTGAYLQEILLLKSNAAMTIAAKGNKEERLRGLIEGVCSEMEAILAAPNTQTANKIRKTLKSVKRRLYGMRRELVVRKKLEDKSIQGVERAKLLDELLTSLQMQHYFNTPLHWEEKAPYVKEIIALDPDNKAGLKMRYGRDMIEHEISKQLSQRDMEGIYKNLESLLTDYDIRVPEERQKLLMRKAKTMMLLNRSRKDVLAVLNQASHTSPRSKLVGTLRAYIKALSNPEVKVKLVGLVGPELVLADGKKVDVSYLNGNSYIGIYSSAHWCGSCRNFTPRLVRFRDASRKTDKKFEVVFSSRDRSEEAMFDYMKGNRMKWPAVIYNSDVREYIRRYLNVSGIPDLAIFDGDGYFISLDGRNDVARLGAEAFKKWDVASKRNAERRKEGK
jgi:nucleoredoxin